MALFAVFAPFARAGGQPPPGAFSSPFTVFRGHSTGLKMYVDLVEERVGFGAHARVSCSNGSEHWQLMIEGGLGGRVDAAGRFHHTEYDPAEAGEMPPSTARPTVYNVEESIIYGVPASFIEIKGRVFSDSVVGWIRFWEGPQRTPGSLRSKCGTGSPDGKWVKFVVHRVNGPAQPHGHWPSRNTGSTSPRPASPAPPQVFCQTPPAQKKGEPPTGFYRVRPRGCRFHRLGLGENSLSDLVFRIHWRHWTATSASGIGRYPVEVINVKTGRHSKSSGPEVVRLSRPRRICGHKVFTQLELRVYIHGQVAGDFESELDEVGEDEEGCPQRR
ncbi:MAG TPA: hypothetical protein VIP57_10645 [Candidatus Dormibacteraeota bacterium]